MNGMPHTVPSEKLLGESGLMATVASHPLSKSLGIFVLMEPKDEELTFPGASGASIPLSFSLSAGSAD